MNSWISKNTEYLTLEEMKNNSSIIYEFFNRLNWTNNAIAGMLGNMQSESTINPGLWQGREIPDNIYTTNKGFGLTQWTPASKLIAWAESNSLQYYDGNTQLLRIQYEQKNNLQWSTDNILNYTWDDYINSSESPEILARVFVWAYERPADPDIGKRQADARFWFNYINRIGKIPLWLLFKIGGNYYRNL